MALKDEIEAHVATIAGADEERRVRFEARARQVEITDDEGFVQRGTVYDLTQADRDYLVARQEAIQAERRLMFPKVQRAIRALLNLTAERTIQWGPATVSITAAEVITKGWSGPDLVDGREFIWTKTSAQPELMLRADITRGPEILRRSRSIHLVPEPRAAIVDGQFDARRAVRVLLATLPEFREQANA